MEPKDALFGRHNLDRVASEALSYNDAKERVSNLEIALSEPDRQEMIEVDILSDMNNLIASLDLHLGNNRNLTMGRSKSRISFSKRPAEVKLFKPHEIVSSEDYPGVEFATSMLSMDLFKRFTDNDEEDEPVAKLVLLKLDHAEAGVTSKDLEVGVNTQFGAIIEDDTIKPFKLETRTPGDKVIYQSQRPDPTEEDGIVVEAQVIEKSNATKRLEMTMIDANKDPEVHGAILDEIDKFIASRREVER